MSQYIGELCLHRRYANGCRDWRINGSIHSTHLSTLFPSHVLIISHLDKYFSSILFFSGVFSFFFQISDCFFLPEQAAPGTPPREAPTQEAPGGTQRRPQEAPQETARRKPPEGQDGPAMCMICAALCAAISRAQGGPTCSQCSQQC